MQKFFTLQKNENLYSKGFKTFYSLKEVENLHIFFSIAVHEHDLSSPPQEPLIVLLKKRLPKLKKKKKMLQ